MLPDRDGIKLGLIGPQRGDCRGGVGHGLAEASAPDSTATNYSPMNLHKRKQV